MRSRAERGRRIGPRIRRNRKDPSMSQPKQLKKLARDRMARTGESYTLARKHILAGKPEGTSRPAAEALGAEPAPATEPEEVELPEYPAPEAVVQYDAALWHRVLTQAGVTHPLNGQPLSEALLAGLAGGIGFMVFTFEYEETTTATVVTRAHPEPYVANLLSRCGAPIREQTTSSTKVAQANLDAALDEGRAVVVRVTEALLPWASGAEAEESESIDVAVVGEHDDGNYLVDDGGGELQLISPAELAAARGRRKKDRQWQAWAPRPATPEAEVLGENAAEAVRATAARLLGRSELVGIPAHFAKNFGVAGMRTWVEKLRDTRTRKGWAALFADPDRLYDALAQVRDFLESPRFGGTGGLRGQYADFLDEAARLPVASSLPGLAEAAEAYRALAPKWTELAEAVDPDVDPEERAALFARLADLLEEIADAEEAAARLLLPAE
jgi:hypothetical protein